MKAGSKVMDNCGVQAVRPKLETTSIMGVPPREELNTYEEDDEFKISPGGASSGGIQSEIEEGKKAGARELGGTPTLK